jgi:hypothetical protein
VGTTNDLVYRGSMMLICLSLIVIVNNVSFVYQDLFKNLIY